MLARLLLIVTLALLATSHIGCQTARPYAAAPPTDDQGIERNHGYSLLYSTIEAETQVDQVLMIKNPRSEVRDLLREISRFAQDAKQKLDDFAETDETLGYDEHGLPFVEAKTRDLITQTTSRKIMMSGRATFELDILITQHEALSYIKHLARALKEIDDNDDRLAFLEELSSDADSLHQRAIELMRTATLRENNAEDDDS